VVGSKSQRRFLIRRKLLDGVLDHSRDDFSEVWAGELETRVVIDFDEPWFEVLVYHEIESKDFKVILFSLRIYN
jgi:hypothetical protein